MHKPLFLMDTRPYKPLCLCICLLGRVTSACYSLLFSPLTSRAPIARTFILNSNFDYRKDTRTYHRLSLICWNNDTFPLCDDANLIPYFYLFIFFFCLRQVKWTDVRYSQSARASSLRCPRLFAGSSGSWIWPNDRPRWTTWPQPLVNISLTHKSHAQQFLFLNSAEGILSRTAAAVSSCPVLVLVATVFGIIILLTQSSCTYR